MHKPAQVELQLDRLQLPYSETLGPITAGGSLAHYRRRQPNISYHTKKAPTTIKKFNKKITYILSFKFSYNNLEKGYEKIIFLKKYLAKNMNGIEILLQDVYTILNNVLKNLV